MKVLMITIAGGMLHAPIALAADSGTYPTRPIRFVTDFTPITLLATTPYVLVAHPSVAAASMRSATRRRSSALSSASRWTSGRRRSRNRARR